MSKFFQAFLTGIFFTFILDFFLFLGIKLHYIDFYKIDLYYNILFADHQNIYIYSFIASLLGFVIIYVNNNKISGVILSLLFSIVLLTLVEPIGKSVGEFLLMQKNIILKDAKYTYRGDIYYEGRKNITFYDYELQKVILLEKDSTSPLIK